MGFYYGTFTCTPSTLVSTLKTQIANSTDWSNITGDIMKSTTTRGAQLVLNCNKVSVDSTRLGLSAWRQHNGTTGTDESPTIYLRWRHNGGATSDNLYGIISVSKEHLWISIEGPKAGDSNAFSSQYGSPQMSLYLGDLVPYHAGDTVPTCALVAYSDGNGMSGSWNSSMLVGRNMGDSLSWVTAYMGSVCHPSIDASSMCLNPYAKGDGKTYVFPYLVFESADGLRGRLAECFFGGNKPGRNGTRNMNDSGLIPGQEITYSGNTYKVYPGYRQVSTGGNDGVFSMPWGDVSFNGTNYVDSYPLVAVRKA